MESQNNVGLRLLSLDGGGIRGMSELLILQEIMQRIQYKENLDSVPLPCEYFDMIGGTSTGGLIALMIGRLRMSMSDTIMHYDSLAKKVFSDGKKVVGDGHFKGSVLRDVVRELVEAKTANADSLMMETDSDGKVCKTFVCARAAENMNAGKPVLFRTYRAPKNVTSDCTIWEAARATSAAPTIFKRIMIGGPGSRQPYIDGGVGINNPTEQVLQEAESIFPDRYIACIISIGTGKMPTIRIPKPGPFQRAVPVDVIKAMTAIATDCEKIHELLASRFQNNPHVYFRFNVEQGMQGIKLAQWEQLDKVAAHTLQHLKMQEVDQRIEVAVETIRKRHGVIATAQINCLPVPKRKPVLKTCPSPTYLFTGREDILSLLHQCFTPSAKSVKVTKQRRFVLHGLGGGGKTQLGLKFIEECQVDAQPPRFSDVFFIDASSAQTIDNDLKNIALVKDIGDSADDMIRWLAGRREEWLLLFDNADDLKLNLSGFFPSCAHGNILITSRNRETRLHATFDYVVASLTQKDAQNLLLTMVKQRVTDETQHLAASIVKELGCLALAVVQAGAYISMSGDLHGYLDSYRRRRITLLQERGIQTTDDYKWTVYTTWQISFERLKPPAVTFLQLCAFMHHDGISEKIFRNAAATTLSEVPREATDFLDNFLDLRGDWDPTLFLDMTNELGRYSLIDFDNINKVFSVHPLVHAWTRTTITNGEHTRSQTKSILGMSITWRRWLEDYSFRRTLLPHIDEVLQDSMFTGPDISENLVLVYIEGSQWKKAEELQVQVMETEKRVLGVEHPDMLRSMGNLASIYRNQGQWKKAEELQVQVMETEKRVLGVEHPDTLTSINNLGLIYLDQGRQKEAEELQVQVMETTKRVLGAEHPAMLTSISNLASTYWNQGRLKEAEVLQVQVVKMTKKVLGAEHPDTLAGISNLALTYRNQGQCKEAEELEVQVTEMRKRVLGMEHPDTLTSMHNLASTYQSQGRWKEAEELHAQVMEMRKSVLGAEHPNTLMSISNLASTYWNQGQWKEAEKLQVQVMEMEKMVLGAEHPDTLTSIGNLALTYLKQGRWNEAEKLQVQVMEMTKRVLGVEHPDTLTSIGNLVSTYRSQGQQKKAEELEVQLMEMRMKVLGVEHPDTLISMSNIASTYWNQGQFKQTEELEVQIMETRKRVLGVEHPDTLRSIDNLVLTYQKQGYQKEAEELEAQIMETRKRVLGAEHSDMLMSIGNHTTSC